MTDLSINELTWNILPDSKFYLPVLHKIQAHDRQAVRNLYIPKVHASVLPWHPHPDDWSARPKEADWFPCLSIYTI